MNQVNAQHGINSAKISGEISTYDLFHDKYTTDKQNNHIIKLLYFHAQK
jgi:hypothetical protein